MSPYLRKLRDKVGHELLLLPSVGAIVWNDEGHVLLQQRQDTGIWDIPGGALDPGEEPAQSLVREVWEETGLVVVPRGIVGVFSGQLCHILYPNGDEAQYMLAVFECQKIRGSLGCHDGESTNVQWFPPDRLPPLNRPYPHWMFERGRRGLPFEWDPAWLEPLR
ncbi:MAG TPA: NUDIX domain-containing protein [Candidatus Xenobia bacterium]